MNTADDSIDYGPHRIKSTAAMTPPADKPMDAALKDTLEGLEHELRHLYGVKIIEGERRISHLGLRLTLADGRCGYPGYPQKVIGGKAICSCCGEPQSAIIEWQLLNLCAHCVELARPHYISGARPADRTIARAVLAMDEELRKAAESGKEKT